MRRGGGGGWGGNEMAWLLGSINKLFLFGLRLEGPLFGGVPGLLFDGVGWGSNVDGCSFVDKGGMVVNMFGVS